MSLNEIYDNPQDQSVKTWQNYRFNNLNISDNFNIPTGTASPGSVLQIGAGNTLTWAPFNQVISQPLSYAYASTLTNSINTNNKVLFVLSGFTSSAAFSQVSNGIQCDVSYATCIISTNISSVPSTTSMPVYQVSLIRNGVERILNKMSPYRIGNSTTIDITCSGICAVEMIQNDRIVIYGQLTSSSTTDCQVISAETSISVIKVN